MNNLTTEKNRRVLVIDDNRAIHDDFRKILSPAIANAAALDAAEAALFGSAAQTVTQTQFEVDSAYQGQEGVLLVEKALAEGRPYAMAFVDVRMPPGLDGVETTRKIWELDPDIQIVICTAYSDYSWGEMFEKLGQRDGLLILKKPFDGVEAFQLAHALTEKWWLHQESRQKMEELESRVAERTSELQWKTAFLEAQVNSSIDGILVVDQDGKQALQNQRFVDLLRIPQHIGDEKADENRLQWVTSLTKNPEQFVEKVRYLYSHPNEISRDIIEFKDGITLDRYSSPVVGKDGKYYGRIWTFRDITESKRLEQAMRESEERFSGAFEHAPIGVGLVSPEGRWIKVNRALCHLVGYSEAELLTRTFQDITHPDDLELDLENVRRMIAGEIRSYQMEKRYVHARGHLVAVLLDVSLVRDGQGQPRYFISQIQDITERKQAENALRESEARTRLLVKSSNIGLWDWNIISNEVFFSEEWKNQLGYTDAEMPNQLVEWETRLHPDDRVATFAAVKDYFEGRRADYEVEFRLRHKDGTWRWILTRANPTFDASGRPARLMGCHIDITERKQAALVSTRLAAIIESSADAIIAKDLNSIITDWNKGAEKLFGYSAGEIVGTSIKRLMPTGQPDEHNHILERIRRGENVEHFDTLRQTKDGTLIDISVTASPIKDTAGEVIGVSIVARDITERKQAEKALRESDEKFHQLADNITDAFWIRSPDMREVHYVSPAFERIWGRSVESLYANPQEWSDFILPEDRERVLAAFTALTGDAPSLDIEYRIVRPDAEIRWVRVRGFQVRDAANKLIRHTGIVTDITERHRVAEELRESDRRFSDMLGNLDLVSMMLDREARVTWCNDCLLQLTGWQREEVIGRHWPELFLPLERHTELRRVQAALLDDQPAAWHYENEILTRSGARRLIRWNNSVLRSGAGAVIGTASIGEDITERKQAEAALQSSESRKNAIVRSSLDCIVVADHEGRILEFNPAAEKVFGCARAQVLGRDWVEVIVPPARREEHHQGMLHYLATGESKVLGKRIEITAMRSDGSEFPVELAITRMGVETPPLFTGFIRDLSERKRLEAQLLHSQKMETVGKLAGGVAHEFNSIMTAIIGQSELLLNDLPPGNPLCKNAAEIYKAADRAASLTRQLLAYGRKQILRPEILDLNSVLAGMESTLRHLLGRGSDVRIVLAAGLKAVKADAGQIEQVIMNMAMNAADAMPNGGKLTLETANVTLDQDYVSRFPELKAGEYVMLAITDTGTGMSEAVKARVFEPFFSTKGVGQGTGLGLSTCYGIINQSGGQISLYSEVARGATFKIYLPQVEPPMKIPLERLDSPGLPRGTETILLVEDDPALREMATTLLQRLGYTVLAAANGIEALSLSQQRDVGHVDLLFTDVVMPHMSGKELSERVQSSSPHTRVLFTSAYTENAIVHQGVLNQGVELLQKPFTPSALAHKLREMLDQPGPSGPNSVARFAIGS